MNFNYRSPRGFTLCVSGDSPIDLPRLTVELYEKWYELFLIRVDGVVESISYELLDNPAWRKQMSAYVDHVPNPFVVEEFAEFHGYVLDILAEELIRGRWEMLKDC